MNVKIITEKMSKSGLKELAKETYGEMVKAVVDVGSEILAAGGEMHADAEACLLNHGSRQQNLWGINLYPDKEGQDRIVYTSLINIRPRDGNRSLEIKDDQLRKRIAGIVDRRIEWDH